MELGIARGTFIRDITHAIILPQKIDKRKFLCIIEI